MHPDIRPAHEIVRMILCAAGLTVFVLFMVVIS